MFGNPCFDPKTGVSKLFLNSLTQKQVFLTQKQEIISEFISKLFSQNFLKFEKFGFFQKKSELRKPNISETHENEKFGNFGLTQGLIVKHLAGQDIIEKKTKIDSQTEQSQSKKNKTCS